MCLKFKNYSLNHILFNKMHCTKNVLYKERNVSVVSVVTCVFNYNFFFVLFQITDADARHNFTTSFSMSMVSLKHN